ncbi:MAG: ABC transporter permease [Dehalococcoidia bacterium]|nr:ABC transporter permease [Dehalococcoidia bacterium]
MQENLVLPLPVERIKYGLAKCRSFFTTYKRPVETVGTVIFIALAWEFGVSLEFLDRMFVSPPSAVFALAVEMFFRTGEIYPHLLISAQEGAIGFAIAIALGVPIGMAMGRLRHVRNILTPSVMALYSTPLMALIPLIMIWLGLGLWAKVVIVVMGAVFPVLINTKAGVEAADPLALDVARSFTATEGQVWRKIILPFSIPYILAGLRLAAGMALMSIFVAELFGATRGLGFMIVRAGRGANMKEVFLGVAIFAAAGILSTLVFRAMEKRVAPWLFVRPVE